MSAGAATSTVVGITDNRDGTKVVYVRSALSAGGGAQTDTPGRPATARGGAVQGDGTLLTAITLDQGNAVTDVSATLAGTGQTAGLASGLFGDANREIADQQGRAVAHQASLPVRSAQDRAVAERFFLAAGIAQLDLGTLGQVTLVPPDLSPTTPQGLQNLSGATSDFVTAAKDHGDTTRQTFTVDSKNVDINADLGFVLDFGVAGGTGSVTRSSTGGQYWDGTAWQRWSSCA